MSESKLLGPKGTLKNCSFCRLKAGLTCDACLDLQYLASSKMCIQRLLLQNYDKNEWKCMKMHENAQKIVKNAIILTFFGGAGVLRITPSSNSAKWLKEFLCSFLSAWRPSSPLSKISMMAMMDDKYVYIYILVAVSKRIYNIISSDESW